MKPFAISLSSALLVISLFSCHKDNAHSPAGTPPSTDTTGAMKISLAMPADTAVKNCELIISETGGKILLDTLSPTNVTVNAVLRTNATLVDITLVTQYQYPQVGYHAFTYKAVNPTNWVTAEPGFTTAPLVRTTPVVQAEILYRHVPYDPLAQFFNYLNPTIYIDGASNYDSLDITYAQIPGNYDVLLLPSKAKYLIRVPKGVHDTVDFSTAQYDPAIVLPINISSYYTLGQNEVIGISDTTDANRATFVYFNPLLGPTAYPQVIYPRTTKFQKYVTYSFFEGQATRESINVYAYGDTASAYMDYPPANAYVINSSQNNNFSLTINAAKPAYYTTTLTGSGISWVLYASPDSTHINPVGLLTAQKSKLLQGQPLTSLNLSLFSCERIPGLGYSDYFAFTCNPALLKAKRIASSIAYYKYF